MTGSGKITRFTGMYAFLSNMHMEPLMFEGEMWLSAEHAYQASKALKPVDRQRIRSLQSPRAAKRAGRLVEIRPDWERIKIDTMLRILRAKFIPTSRLAYHLIATHPNELIEGNYWNDRFWGVFEGVGENHLGKLLMKVRDELMLPNEPEER